MSDFVTFRELMMGLLTTDSHGLTHVTDGETTERRVLGESLNAHGLGRNHLDDGSVTAMNESACSKIFEDCFC